MEEVVEKIRLAILRGDEYYNGIPLPKPHKTGTITQCVAYADQEARLIVERYRIRHS